MTTPVDEYLLRQEQFDMRIKETESYIKWLKKRTGLARHKARKKIEEATKMLEMFQWMKQEDSLPWENGPTFSSDGLLPTASLH